MIHYEYPFNERIRTLLRLESLFERFNFFFAQDDALQHHVSLTTLFEVADVASRADLRTDLLKELDRQRQVLAALRHNPQINHAALEAVLSELDAAHAGIAQMQGKTGLHLSDNEWLSSIRSRAIIPGGTCEFDLPSYAAWQRGAKEARQRDLHKWMAPFTPLREATALVLRLLRESGHSSKVLATGGSFQQMLSGKSYQLMQVAVDDLRLIPETSANKYMMWVRFTQQDGDGRPRPFEGDVPFVLTLCMV